MIFAHNDAALISGEHPRIMSELLIAAKGVSESLGETCSEVLLEAIDAYQRFREDMKDRHGVDIDELSSEEIRQLLINERAGEEKGNGIQEERSNEEVRDISDITRSKRTYRRGHGNGSGSGK